jgi:hypothetical protein
MQPGCGWTDRRPHTLPMHFKKAHPGVPFPKHEGCMIYDAKGLVKQLLNEEITVEQAECEARLSFQCRATELGKQDIWHVNAGRGVSYLSRFRRRDWRINLLV